MNKLTSLSLIIDVTIIRVIKDLLFFHHCIEATTDPSVDVKVINIGLTTETSKRNKLRKQIQVVTLTCYMVSYC